MEPASHEPRRAALHAAPDRLRRAGAAGRNGAARKCHRAESLDWLRADTAFEHESKYDAACTASVSGRPQATVTVPDSASCRAATTIETKRSSRVPRVIEGNVTASAVRHKVARGQVGTWKRSIGPCCGEKHIARARAQLLRPGRLFARATTTGAGRVGVRPHGHARPANGLRTMRCWP